MIRRAICLLALCAQPVLADAHRPAEAAIDLLNAAAASLANADTARDRVAALTETISAYERGLHLLRDGIRRTVLAERRLTSRFEAAEARIVALTGALMAIERRPVSEQVLHPGGPVDGARAAMVLAEVRPQLQKEANILRITLEDLRGIRTVQENARITLERGLLGASQARTELGQAIADRASRKSLSDTDAAILQALVSSADTLQGFLENLSGLGETQAETGFAGARGRLPLPAQGTVLAGFEQPGADGISRPGLTLAAAPGALVSAPHAATVRYAGPLLNLGQVVILEPAPGYLMILSGLGQVFAREGDILAPGAPLGLMDGEFPAAEQILIESAAGRGQDQSQTLYIELRLDRTPVDPGDWFEADEQTGRSQ